MKVQVLVDGQDKGVIDVGGAELESYAQAVANFSDLVCAIYASENEDGPDYISITSDYRLVPIARRSRAGRRSR